eukprot:jgi/Botrbrau1/18218/Bobra.53_1s0075.1
MFTLFNFQNLVRVAVSGRVVSRSCWDSVTRPFTTVRSVGGGSTVIVPTLYQHSNLPMSSVWKFQTRWMGAPKRKVSPHRRGMRNANNRIHAARNLAQCRKCGMLMMPHQIPHYFCKDEECPSKYKGNPTTATKTE